jgi:DegV family protein with EDD domain
MIRIITDSTCEAPPAVLGHPAVTVLPLSVVFGKTALRDGVEITREQFWDRLPQSNPLPTTSQATPADFIGLYRDFTARGDEVVVLVLSAKLSGTYSSAVIAQESQAGWPVDVVDSRSVSVGLGLMLQEAVAMIEAGASRAEIVARLNAMRDHVHIIFALETLEYLQRGGRIGKAQAFVGTLLKFKPLLGVVDGEVVPVTRVRSRTKALEEMQDRLSQLEPTRGEQVRLGVTYALVPDEAAAICQTLATRFGTQSAFISALGPVLGVHVGPGTIGVAVYAAK